MSSSDESAAGKGTVRFLSKSWLELLEHALAGAEAVPDVARLALGQIVLGDASGEVAFTVLVGGGERAELLEGTELAQVTLVEDVETARAIASGASPAPFLAAGKVRLRGDANALIEGKEALAALGEVLGTLAARTNF